jgi:aminodeoxyfutalosine deaminase
LTAGGTTYPKIELHVHLEATVSPERLLELGRRNDVKLPSRTVPGLRRFCRFSGFDRFIRVWIKTTRVLRHARDFHQIVVDYAAELAEQGCSYAEPLFSPSEPVQRGTPWQEVFEGYCDGAEEARELHGVDMRFTPDITRDFPPEVGERLAEWAVRFRERGVVGISLGGSEHLYPPAPFARAFAIAREGGLKAAPHAGEVVGPASIRSALDDLRADRLRHGVRAVEDPALLAELAERGIVCDVTPVSNLRTGVVLSLEQHPLPAMLAAGVRCSIGSDDPALMQTSLTEDSSVAVRLGHTPRAMYEHAVAGAFCDEATRARLATAGEAFEWPTAGP